MYTAIPSKGGHAGFHVFEGGYVFFPCFLEIGGQEQGHGGVRAHEVEAQKTGRGSVGRCIACLLSTPLGPHD